MKLYHGSYESEKPVVKAGSDFVFDGIFAGYSENVAASHGEYVHEYEIADDKIASTYDLDECFDIAKNVLAKETFVEDEDKLAVLFDIAVYGDDESEEEILEKLEEAEISVSDLMPRTDRDICGAISWEFQRLRGRIAKAAGFEAVEMSDEHGTSYLILG